MNGQSLTRRRFLEKNVMATAGVGLAGSRLKGAAAAAAESVIPTRLERGEKLRVAILGCGNRSKNHIRAVNHYGDQFEVHALCDILPEMLEEKKQLVESGAPKLFRDYQKMLKEEELHAVIIVLPNTLHRQARVVRETSDNRCRRHSPGHRGGGSKSEGPPGGHAEPPFPGLRRSGEEAS